MRSETEQDPVGPSQLQKLFHVPCFLFVGKDFGLLGFPEFQIADSSSC